MGNALSAGVGIRVSSDFIKAYDRLDNNMKKQVQAELENFRKNPNASGTRLKQLQGCAEPGMSSIRIEAGYRIILYPNKESREYTFLYVAQHDDAIRWGVRKKLRANELTNALQMYVVPEETPQAAEDGLFPAEKYADNSLLRIGVPEEQLPLVRSIRNADDLWEHVEDFPAEVMERLLQLAEGQKSVSQLIELTEINTHIAAGNPDKNPDTLRSFVFGGVDEEMEQLLESGSLEAWRVFLHPKQRWLADRSFNGAVYVKGSAGTGKTVVALHRAKFLASRLIAEGREGKVLYTFYTTNLTDDITGKLRSICTQQEMERIDVSNIDKIAARLNTIPGYAGAELVYSGSATGAAKLDKLWEDAVAAGDPEGREKPDFYREEWDRVVVPQTAYSQEAYLAAKRVGRKIGKTQAERAAIWQVFAAYLRLMQERRQVDSQTAMYLYAQYAASHPALQYAHVVADEIQDFNSAALRLIRALTPEGRDDLFLTGDPRQKIYSHNAVFPSCGIWVRGRTYFLDVNYRTTRQIRETAMRALDGMVVRSLSEYEEDRDSQCLSCTSGAAPQIRFFSDATEEAAWILGEIEALTRCGVPLEDICLTAYTNKQTETYAGLLRDGGLRVYSLKQRDDRTQPGIRLGTMHRVKGLEFQIMFLAGVDQGVFPPKRARYQQLDRAKCLLYVALTRARTGAYVSGSGTVKSPFLELLEKQGRV